MELKLGYWLRQDAFINDFSAWLEIDVGNDQLRIWTSPSKEQEVIPYRKDRHATSSVSIRAHRRFEIGSTFCESCPDDWPAKLSNDAGYRQGFPTNSDLCFIRVPSVAKTNEPRMEHRLNSDEVMSVGSRSQDYEPVD